MYIYVYIYPHPCPSYIAIDTLLLRVLLKSQDLSKYQTTNPHSDPSK